MKEILKKTGNKIKKDKGILFLLLIAFYAGTAGGLHLLYKNGMFAAKQYKEQNYSFSVTKADEEGNLEFEITRCSDDLGESAKKGDTFIINSNTIYYQDYEYKYKCMAEEQDDYYVDSPDSYYVEFPDGETYNFDRYSLDEYYKETEVDISAEVAEEQAAMEEFQEAHNAYWEAQGEDVESTEVHKTSDEPVYETGYLPSEAPDSKFSPDMIRSAISSYQKYTQTFRLCDSESEIFKYTLPVWLVGTVLLCLMEQILEWQMAKISFITSVESTEPERLLEPSKWRKIIYAAGCAVCLVVSYAGLVFGYMSLR